MTFATRLLGYTEADLEIAAILEPPPSDDYDDDPAAQYPDWIERLEDRAATIQLMTRSYVAGESNDPLPMSLELLRRQRNEIEQQMILLVAYMRETIKPRPYTLQRVADAAGLSVSGVRTFYTQEDVSTLADRIRNAKQIIADEHARRGSTPGRPSIPISAERNPDVTVAQDGTIEPVIRHNSSDQP